MNILFIKAYLNFKIQVIEKTYGIFLVIPVDQNDDRFGLPTDDNPNKRIWKLHKSVNLAFGWIHI